MLAGDDITVMTAVIASQLEAQIVSDFDDRKDGVVVVRRCVDIAEVLAVAYSGAARALLVSADMPGLDRHVIDQLRAAGVGLVAVLEPMAPAQIQERLPDLGLHHVVAADAGSAAIATAVRRAVVEGAPAGRGPMADAAADHRFPPNPPGAELVPGGAPEPRGRGSGTVVAVWGPAGSPGRSTIALTLADEASRLGVPTMLVDADVYGGAIAPMLGLLDEAPGLAAACRLAAASSIDTTALARVAVAIGPNFRLLTGISRVDRWPELRPAAISEVLTTARRLAAFTVVDCGFSIEQDEELSYDTIAPRRNGATIAALGCADRIVMVSGADPVSVARSVRALGELAELIPATRPVLVVNRVRGTLFSGDPHGQLDAAFGRFAEQTVDEFVPDDPSAIDAALRTARTLAEAAPSSGVRTAARRLAVALTGAEMPAKARRRRQ